MTTTKQKKVILNLISEIPNQQLQKLIDSRLLADMLIANTDVIDKDEFRKIIGLSYSVTVDYNLTVEEMVEKGQYDIPNPAICSSMVKIKRSSEKVKIELVHFNVPMDDNDVIQRLLERNLRPINLSELLAFGAKYPEKQLAFPIVALGSWIIGMKPGLSSCHNEVHNLDIKFRKLRTLCLFDTLEQWPANYRFAVVNIENSSD